ncbi:hotdog fold thioesterase [Fastidiosibacter lacustris]|uniref:hotdog fold thioesterase n=1 Tax=Fastidiosibacter lacustris TaxID=2056695 RepID=UPI000E345D23|nr:hotdog fold thioesterase [Fastidiosibacter lacustris]
MNIWKTSVTIKQINERGEGLFSDLLGIRFTELGNDYLLAEITLQQKHKQPLGIMNGGVSCAIAETVGSTAANYAVDLTTQYCVGLDINTNHIRPATSGILTAKAYPHHIGRTTQVWAIEIKDEQNRLISINRLTMAVKDR